MENKILIKRLELLEVRLIKKMEELLGPVMDFISIQQAIIESDLHDIKMKGRAIKSSGKPMPEIIGGWYISTNSCKKCKGKITWDQFDKQSHRWPDHVGEDGMFIKCGEWLKEEKKLS